MDLYDLRDANFGSLATAVGDWGDMVRKLQTLEKDAQHGLKGFADKADWRGYNAEVTKKFVARTAREFTDAHTEATSIHNILKDTHDELVGHQKQLRDALADADRQNLWVSCSGSQIIVTAKQSTPNGPDPSTYSQSDLDAMLKRVQEIVRKATESDSSAAKALDALVKQDPYGFSNAKYKDRDTAAKAIEDAEKYANLMKKKGDGLSPQEFDALNRILRAHRGDPLFQEKFAETLGPRGLLTFWADIADPGDHGLLQGTRRGQFGELQKNLGMVLAGATQSDSPAMQKWENELVGLGNQKITDTNSRMYGYQLASNLMRTGNWNDQFLGRYSNSLVALEKQRHGRADVLWGTNTGTGLPARMNFLGEDNGRDPMAGVMQAMSNSPEAAAHFFDDKGNAQYVLKDRPLIETTPDNRHDGNQTTEAAGRALQAATTGINPNDPHARTAPHTYENQLALKNALAVLGSGAQDGMHSELRDDMARILVDHREEFLQSVDTGGIDSEDRLNQKDLAWVTKQIARDGASFRILDGGLYQAGVDGINADRHGDHGSLRTAGSAYGFLEECREQAIGTDEPSKSWLTQYGAPVAAGVASDLLPRGGNTFSALANIGIEQWQDHEQKEIDAGTANKVQAAYDLRTHRMDEFGRQWRSEHPHADWRAAVGDGRSAATTARSDVRGALGVMTSRSGSGG